jgi:hypothetical protein
MLFLTHHWLTGHLFCCICTKAGVVPGQKLISISDPIRPDQQWSLQDRPSLRFVKDLINANRNKDLSIEMSAKALYFEAPQSTATGEACLQGVVVGGPICTLTSSVALTLSHSDTLAHIMALALFLQRR